MGDVEENIEFASHVRAGIFRGYCYSVGRSTPAFHTFSPDMTAQEKATAKAASGGAESVWVDAHPPAVKSWLLAQPPDRRAACQVACSMA